MAILKLLKKDFSHIKVGQCIRWIGESGQFLTRGKWYGKINISNDYGTDVNYVTINDLNELHVIDLENIEYWDLEDVREYIVPDTMTMLKLFQG